MTRTIFCHLATFLTLVGLTGRAEGQVPVAAHVVVIGVDGLSPDGVEKAATPRLHAMMGQGAWTLHARGVMPTVSSPNWASMIMGAGPEQHGVTSNEWTMETAAIRPTVAGRGGFFPTIFRLVREQRPRAKIACFHEWDGFARLFDNADADKVEHPKGPAQTAERSADYFQAEKPDFLFVHLDLVDDAGHEHGHGSPAYYRSVEEADRLVGVILDAVQAAGIAEGTVVLVTSDHGGVGKGHGGSTMREIEIPWILRGPGVAVGREITAPVNTYDTAATVAHVLGVNPPECWVARPVRSAFAASK